MKSILLITHDTSLSGAPKSILLVFEELVKMGINVTTVAIKGGGKLENRFKHLSKKYYRLDVLSKKTHYNVKNRFKKKILGIPFLSEYDFIIQTIIANKFDTIYCNTIVSLRLGIELNKIIGCKLILHVHELKTVIDEYFPKLSDYENEIDTFIVPSSLNKSCLNKDFFISLEKVFVIRETTESHSVGLRKSFDNQKINVLMCGGAYWRKGDDIFIQIANLILKKDKRFTFFWVGNQSDERKRVNKLDITNLGISEYVHFIGEVENPTEWYLKADIFLLSSREDPFPLAAMDAGIFGIPIFCFENATGIEEVINKECIVPYLDLTTMSDRIISLINNFEVYNLVSDENKNTFYNFTPDVISQQIIKLL